MNQIVLQEVIHGNKHIDIIEDKIILYTPKITKDTIKDTHKEENNLIIDIYANSSLTLITLNAKKSSKTNIIINLKEPKANITIITLISGGNKEDHNISTIINHLAQNTYSNMKTQGILQKGSTCSQKGLIKIHNNAFGSEAYQHAHIILADKNCKAEAIPNLEIENNDVLCSHGTTITTIKEEHLTYLKSRGITNEESEKMILTGHLQKEFQNINSKEIISKIKKIIWDGNSEDEE